MLQLVKLHDLVYRQAQARYIDVSEEYNAAKGAFERAQAALNDFLSKNGIR